MANRIASAAAAPRLLQELGETRQRLRLGGPFYVLLWILAGTASGIWDRARWPFLLVGVGFILLTVARFRVRDPVADRGDRLTAPRAGSAAILINAP